MCSEQDTVEKQESKVVRASHWLPGVVRVGPPLGREGFSFPFFKQEINCLCEKCTPLYQREKSDILSSLFLLVMQARA